MVKQQLDPVSRQKGNMYTYTGVSYIGLFVAYHVSGEGNPSVLTENRLPPTPKGTV